MKLQIKHRKADPGAVVVSLTGKVIGAIGVSGGSGQQDHAVAEAGAAAVS